jgi:tetratricopeptide (TPR) repeat protein
MKLDESKIDLFDRYIYKALPNNENKSFENSLRNDSELKNEFDEYLKSTNAIKLIALRGELGQIIDINEKKTSIFRTGLVWMPIAASLLLFIFYFWPKAGTSDGDLFLTYYRPYPNIVTTRSEENRLTKALQAYTSRDYSKAILLFNEISPATDTTLFYQGLCYLSLNDYKNSLLTFERVSINSTFYQQLYWYKSMAFLSKGDRPPAILHLQRIESNQYNYREAREILLIIGK